MGRPRVDCLPWRKRGYRRELYALAEDMRATGYRWPVIAEAIQEQEKCSLLAAMRMAHGWSQGDLATQWNRRWPDELKTFKNFSYWEQWPALTGRTPRLPTLIRLAELFECSVSDLLAGVGDFRHLDRAAVGARLDDEPAQLALGQHCPHGCTVFAYALQDQERPHPLT